jgi:hypothetical protein
VTFTHESWAQINSEMDSRFVDARIIGWYHSHPDFGIFLSERDCFIQEHFFSGAGQIAYVVDPVRDLEGVFEWRGGKPEPMSHYWIGDEIRTVEASRRNPIAEASQAELAVAATVDGPASRQSLPLSTAALMLGGLSLLLLGYLYGGWRSRWEQNKIVEGAVAHYGVHKLMKLGMEENLTDVLRHLRAIRQEFAKLPESTEGLTNEQRQAAAKQRKVLADNLFLSQRTIENIQRFYALSEVERNALARLITRKQQELMAPPPKQQPTKSAQKTAKQSMEESAPAEGNQNKNREPDAKMVDPSNGESEPTPTKQEDSTS